MSEPERQYPDSPITPHVSNYGLLLTVYILYLVGLSAWPCEADGAQIKRQP
jgi:hypothetical protein